MVRTLAHVDTARNRLFLSGLPVTEDFCTIALTITLNLVYPLLSESGRKLSKLMTIDRRFVFRAPRARGNCGRNHSNCQN